MDPYFFASYAREDAEPVLKVVEALRRHGIKIWLDRDELQPGVSWVNNVANAIKNSSGLLLFMSPRSMGSQWVQNEFQLAMEVETKTVGILLKRMSLNLIENFELRLTRQQWFILEDYNSFDEAIDTIAKLLKSSRFQSKSLDLSRDKIDKIALETVENILHPLLEGDRETNEATRSIFVVHGNDLEFRDMVEKFLASIGIDSIVLSKMPSQHPTLAQKFFEYGNRAKFAVVLVSADDLGVSSIQFHEPEVGDRALQFRARQNVILELGFFYGHLGLQNVFVLYKKPNKVFPNFERPSDLDGVLFDEVDDSGVWMESLKSRLYEAGFFK